MKLILIFIRIIKKKQTLAKMDTNAYYLELMFILLNIFWSQKLINKSMKAENFFLKKKRSEPLEKKIGCKFIRINTSNAKRGYDTGYEVSKIQMIIIEFWDKKKKKKKTQ